MAKDKKKKGKKKKAEKVTSDFFSNLTDSSSRETDSSSQVDTRKKQGKQKTGGLPEGVSLGEAIDIAEDLVSRSLR